DAREAEVRRARGPEVERDPGDQRQRDQEPERARLVEGQDHAPIVQEAIDEQRGRPGDPDDQPVGQEPAQRLADPRAHARASTGWTAGAGGGGIVRCTSARAASSAALASACATLTPANLTRS